MDAINLQEKFSLFDEHWQPHVIAELNGQQVKLAKLKGEFVWHEHEDEDELFHVLSGTLEMHFRDRVVKVGPGEVLVVPRGMEHRPVAHEEVQVLLFEPASTVNTGSAPGELTVDEPKRI